MKGKEMRGKEGNGRKEGREEERKEGRRTRRKGRKEGRANDTVGILWCIDYFIPDSAYGEVVITEWCNRISEKIVSPYTLLAPAGVDAVFVAHIPVGREARRTILTEGTAAVAHSTALQARFRRVCTGAAGGKTVCAAV
jgi:hypothetical protein